MPDSVSNADVEARHGQHDAHDILFFERRAQAHHGIFGAQQRLFEIDLFKLAVGPDLDQCSVAKPRTQTVHLELVIGDRLFAELDARDPEIAGVVPFFRGCLQLTPVAIRRLKMLRPQKQTFVPVKR